MNLRSEKIAKISILLSVGILLGYIESIISIIPVSGVKIGLSNLIVLYGIYKLGFADSLVIISLKSIIVGLLFNSVMSIMYSLPAGIFSVMIMFILTRLDKENISIYGISIAGSCVFNIVQFIVAAFVVATPVILVNLWYVLPISVCTGYLMAEIFKNIFLKE